jgi:hypothetical protein
LNLDYPPSHPPASPEESSRAGSRQRVVAIALLAALVCSGATSCTRTQVTVSVVAITAAVVLTTVGVTRAVESQHHALRGCLVAGPSGTQLRTSDARIYSLEGETATLKVGERVRLHGSRLKKTKDSTNNMVFVVDRLSKVYGTCP